MGLFRLLLITLLFSTLISCVPESGTTTNKGALGDSPNPAVTNVTSSNSNTTYKIGDVVYISVYFSGPVTVENFPSLALNSGGFATYASGSKTNQLVFKYTVASGETSTALDYSSTTSLSLNGGKIKGSSGGNAKLTLPVPGATNSLRANKFIAIDGVAPKVTGISASTSDGNYTLGDTILIEVNFDSAVLVSGIPELSLDSGGTAKYKSGSTSSKLVFSYVIKAGEKSKDLNYASTSALSFGTGSIKDSSGNDANLLLPEMAGTDSLSANKNLIVNANRVSVISVTTAKESGTYGKNVIFDLIVKFSNQVAISGSTVPTLQLNVNQLATYISGSGKNELKFRYTSAVGDYSSKLDYLSTEALLLNGSKILDTSGYEAKTILPTVGQSGSLSYSKNIIIDAVYPTVVSVKPESSSTTFLTGSTLNILVTFDKAVYVLGAPILKLNNNGVATYLSGSGSTVLKFQYKIMQGSQYNITGLNYYSTSSLELNGGTIVDAVSNAATLTLPALTSSGALGYGTSIVIDTIPAYVTSFTSTSADESIYKEDDKIGIKVVFSKNVTVTGKPSIKMNTTNNGYAKYVSGSGTNELTFSYKVESEQKTPTSGFLDFDSSTAFNLNGATIVDATGYSANLILDSGLTMAGQEIEVNSVRPLITDITVTPDAASVTNTASHNTYYTLGDIFYIVVTFNTDVTVSTNFTARMTLNSGGVANYDSQPTSNTIQFKYTVASGESTDQLDKNKLYAFSVQTGTLTNSAGTSVNTLYDKAITSTVYKVRSNNPTVTAVAINADTGMGYNTSKLLQITVTYSSAVTVTGVPRIELNLGSAARYANYASGSGTTSLVFTHQVAVPDVAEILEYTSPFELNGGTMKDVANNDAILTVSLPTPLRFGKLIEIASEQVNVVSVFATPASGTFYPGDPAIPIIVNFDRKVYISFGSQPKLKLNAGDTAYAYYSAISSDSKTVTFSYPIGSGHTSSDLDVDTSTGLVFSGSEFQDLAGNTGANFISPTAGALADNGSIIINGGGSSQRTLAVTSDVSFADKYQGIDSLAISPSGRYVYANGNDNGKVTLLSRVAGSPLATIPNNTTAIDLPDSGASAILNSTRLTAINNNCLISYNGTNIYTHSTSGVTPDTALLTYVSETPVANLQDMVPTTYGNLLLVESATNSIRAMNISRDCAIDEIANSALGFNVGTISTSLDGRFAYILDTSDTTKLNMVKFNDDNATFTGPTALPTAFNNYAITKVDISPDGHNLYLISSSSNTITKYDRTPDTGLIGNPIVVVTPDVVNLPDPNLMKIGSSGQYLYVANSDSIVTFERDLDPTPTNTYGALKVVDVNSSIDNIASNDRMLITNDGRNIYTTENAVDKLWTVLMRPETGGVPSFLSRVVTTGYKGTMVPPDGRHLYILKGTEILVYSRNPSTGDLIGSSAVAVNGLTAATDGIFSHDGNTLLVTDVNGNPYIRSFVRDLGTGLLTLKSSVVMAANAGATNFDIKTSSDDRAAYVSPIYDGASTAVFALKLDKDGTLTSSSSVALPALKSMDISVDDKRLFLSYLPTPLVDNKKIANTTISLDGSNNPVTLAYSSSTNFTNNVDSSVDSGVMAMHPNGKYIYFARKSNTADNANHVVYAATRSDTTGLITSWNTYSFSLSDLKSVFKMMVSPDGRNLYAITYEEPSAVGGVGPSTAWPSYTTTSTTSTITKTYRLVSFSINSSTGGLTKQTLAGNEDFLFSYTIVTTNTSASSEQSCDCGFCTPYQAASTSTSYTYKNSAGTSTSGAVTPVFSMSLSQDSRSIYITTLSELIIFRVR